MNKDVDREAKIIVLSQTKRLREIAEIMGVSRQRIHQILKRNGIKLWQDRVRSERLRRT